MNDESAVKRATIALMLAQASASSGFLAMTTINAIVAVKMSGNNANFAGVPSALVLGGASAMAYFAGLMAAKYGRQNSLLVGVALCIVGALLSGIGINIQQLWLFMPSLFLFGFGRGALDQSRYAAGDLVPADRRARAISTVVWGGTFGAIVGPQLVNPTSLIAGNLGLNPDSGPAFATVVLQVIAGLCIGLLTIGVDWKGISKRMGALEKVKISTSRWPVFSIPRARAAFITMVCAQSAMSLMMTIISVHMKTHGMGLDEVGNVITAHVLGMFAFSPLVGRLADRIGRQQTIYIGVAVLAAGCIFTPLLLQTPFIMFGEFMVGLGWSLCFVSSAALLTNSLAPEQRAVSQGTTDVFVNAGAAIGALGSGLLLNALNFYLVCAVGLVIAVIPLIAVLSWGRANPVARSGMAATSQ